MDHQNPSHFPSLSHSHPHLCSQTLEEYGQLLPPPYSEVVWKKPAASDNQLGTSLLEVYDATAPSDVRSMSVDPGSMDDQLSSQESWDGVTFDGAAKKKAEGGGEIAGVGEYSGGGSSEKMEEVTTLDKDGVTVAKQSVRDINDSCSPEEVVPSQRCLYPQWRLLWNIMCTRPPYLSPLLWTWRRKTLTGVVVLLCCCCVVVVVLLLFRRWKRLWRSSIVLIPLTTVTVKWSLDSESVFSPSKIYPNLVKLFSKKVWT